MNGMTNFLLFLCALMCVLSLAFFPAFADPPQMEERDLPFATLFEKAQLQRCEFNRFRGEACASLMSKLCQAVEYKNAKCRIYAVRQCHTTHGLDESESRCERGIMFEHCQGNEPKCGSQEREGCRASGFAERYCGRYQWIDCEKDEFRTSVCKIFHNKNMISHHEDKTYDALLWEVTGQNNVRRLLPQLSEGKKQIDSAIAKMESERDSIKEQISTWIGDLFGLDNLKQKHMELLNAIERAKRHRETLIYRLQETEHVELLCRDYGPMRQRTEP